MCILAVAEGAHVAVLLALHKFCVVAIIPENSLLFMCTLLNEKNGIDSCICYVDF